MTDPALRQEVFGPSSLLVRARDVEQIARVVDLLEGQLTATVLFDGEDLPLVAALLPHLERKVGRIIANGWPTGVEVCHAMVHGGPYPATTDVRTTSVGALAIQRFLRPICYQNLPDALLPQALRADNPLGIIPPHRWCVQLTGRSLLNRSRPRRITQCYRSCSSGPAKGPGVAALRDGGAPLAVPGARPTLELATRACHARIRLGLNSSRSRLCGRTGGPVGRGSARAHRSSRFGASAVERHGTDAFRFGAGAGPHAPGIE